MFTLAAVPLPAADKLFPRIDPSLGGMVVFEGRVRDHNEGRRVTGLDYEAYESMAQSEGERILAEARGKFGGVQVACAHRHGYLAVGEVAVVVVAGAPHREEAFAACRWIIDQVKERLPIWKKEHYVDHPSVWVACHRCGGTETVGGGP